MLRRCTRNPPTPGGDERNKIVAAWKAGVCGENIDLNGLSPHGIEWVMMINSISPRVDNVQYDLFFPVKTEQVCRAADCVKPINAILFE